MTLRHLHFLTLFFLGVSLFFVCTGSLFHLISPSEILPTQALPVLRPTPQNRFELSRPSYDKIGSKLLQLHFAPPKMQLPDLQHKLAFLGSNLRPDADPETKPYFIGIANTNDRVAIRPGEKIFLKFDRSLTPARYIFSPHNAPTPLWFEVEPQGESLLIQVSMKDENGQIINTPASLSTFTLSFLPNARRTGRPNSWEIGKYRVDATLLARQRARWYGKDAFIERHGGEEFAALAKKERLDFGEENATYSVYIGLNDVLIWKDDRWVSAESSMETRPYPLMQLKKIEERLLLFELWDSEGEQSVSINLLKSREPWNPKQYLRDFQFVSSRTRTQYIFEIKGVRTILRPHDWLLQKEGEWVKLTTAEQIDDYVHRKLIGVLFIFDGPSKEEGEEALKGTFFNAARSAFETFDLSTATHKPKSTALQTQKESQKEIEAPSRVEMEHKPVMEEGPYPPPREHLHILHI